MQSYNSTITTIIRSAHHRGKSAVQTRQWVFDRLEVVWRRSSWPTTFKPDSRQPWRAWTTSTRRRTGWPWTSANYNTERSSSGRASWDRSTTKCRRTRATVPGSSEATWHLTNRSTGSSSTTCDFTPRWSKLPSGHQGDKANTQRKATCRSLQQDLEARGTRKPRPKPRPWVQRSLDHNSKWTARRTTRTWKTGPKSWPNPTTRWQSCRIAWHPWKQLWTRSCTSSPRFRSVSPAQWHPMPDWPSK